MQVIQRLLNNKNRIFYVANVYDIEGSTTIELTGEFEDVDTY